MKKRAGVGFAASVVLPLSGLVVVMTRILEGWSRPMGFALWGLGWVGLYFAVRRHAPARARVSEARDRAKHAWGENARVLVHVIALIGIGAVLFTLVPVDRVEFVDVPRPLLEPRIERDHALTARLAQQLEAIADRSEGLFRRQGEVISVEARGQLLGAWLEYLDHAVALDRVMELHKYFWQISPLHHRDLNARSFLIGYSALVTQTRALARLERAVDGNRSVESLLDDARPELGIAKGTYSRLKWRLTDPQTLLRLNAGRVHLGILRASNALAARDAVLVTRAREGYERLWELLGRKPELFGDNPLEYLESKAFVAWFPVQKGVAEGMGNLRVTGRDNFVTVAQLQAARSRLQPGDILLERRNWYATNVGLPGFWPHAALYVGTPAELDAFFDGEAERALTGGLSPSRYLAEAMPELRAAYSRPDADGHVPRVIEAIAEGVTLTSLEHSGNADYLAVLRPRLSKRDRLAALVRAFGFHRRPYDFNFDFVTDAALVCSELVYKAYEPGPGKAGIPFELSKAGGRWVLPPNGIARFFAEQSEGKEALSFVLFFDGSEKAQASKRQDVAAFRQTWRRPKWDHLQQ